MVRKSPAKINGVASSIRIDHIQNRRIYRLSDLTEWLQLGMSDYREFEMELHRGSTKKTAPYYTSPQWVGRHLLVSGADFILAANQVMHRQETGGWR